MNHSCCLTYITCDNRAQRIKILIKKQLKVYGKVKTKAIALTKAKINQYLKRKKKKKYLNMKVTFMKKINANIIVIEYPILI